VIFKLNFVKYKEKFSIKNPSCWRWFRYCWNFTL